MRRALSVASPLLVLSIAMAGGQAGERVFEGPPRSADRPGLMRASPGLGPASGGAPGEGARAIGDTRWALVHAGSSPLPGDASAAAYDSARGRVVLFGGSTDARTWEWDGEAWSKRTPATSPPRRGGTAMVDDVARGRLVLFGGTTGNSLSDTWEWDGSTWVQRTPVTSPPARSGHGMAYDSARERVVVFGGYSGASGFMSDTWEWDGSTWVERTPATRPSARENPQMVYDGARGRVVLFGGAGPYPLGDTWEWDGTDWVQKTPGTNSPPARSAEMVYDSVRRRAVLLVEVEPGAGAETWEWDGDRWARIPTATRPPLGVGAFDERRGRIVLFGGWGSASTWEWDGSDWIDRTPTTSPRIRSNHAMAYDSARSRIVLFGGAYYYYGFHHLADTWEWDGSRWLLQAPPTNPPARQWHAMAYDSVRHQVVLVGGRDNDGLVSDTWESDGNTWTLRAGFPPRWLHAVAFDAARERVVLFGGSDFWAFLADTWEWAGNGWLRRFPATSPPVRYASAMAYDSARERIVLFGGYNGITLGDTWEWNGNSWVEKTPVTSPPARLGHAMAYDSARGRVVLFGGYSPDYRFADTWEWDGSAWIETTPATRPVPGPGHSMAFDSARGRVVLFSSDVGYTWEYGPNAHPLADAGADQILECSGGGTALVTLDGSRSFDADSAPDTADDIATFDWFEAFGQPGQTLIATGATPTLALPVGVHDITLRVTDRAGATATDDVAVTVQDTIPPVVMLTNPTSRTLLLPTTLPFHVVFATADACCVHREVVKLADCAIYDGLTYGDQDGLLSDETLPLDRDSLCRVVELCGFTSLSQPELRVEATDCGGNLGSASVRFRGGVKLIPGICNEAQPPPGRPPRNEPSRGSRNAEGSPWRFDR